METLIFATQNQNKLVEIKKILADLERPIKSMSEIGVDIDIEENGSTFIDNAVIKAMAIRPYTDGIILADDSGLEIDCLNKEPGVYSARYLGKDTPYTVKNELILERLKDIPQEQRTARFVCAIAASLPDGRVLTTQATIEGYIGYEAKGTNGFGYDPIFYVSEYGTSTADMTIELKNRISHRGKALEQMKEQLKGALAK